MKKIKNLILYNADCFDIFDKLEKNTIDLFILDLPYNQTACNWDKEIIPLNTMWEHIKRIMKPSAIILFFCTSKFGYKLIHSNPKWFKYDLVWKKSKKVGFLNCNKQPLKLHENIYIFKNKQGTYNPQKTKGKPYNKTNTGNNNNNKCIYGTIDRSNHLEGIEHRKINKGDRFPDTILNFNNPHKPIHRTQKPIDILEWLIKTYSNEGETVLDFTMGSGSTGEACFNCKRQFIGIEKDKEIYNIAETRLINLKYINQLY